MLFKLKIILKYKQKQTEMLINRVERNIEIVYETDQKKKQNHQN